MTIPTHESENPGPATWPGGPGEPPKPQVLIGTKAILFYGLNLLIVFAVAAPVLGIEPLALQGLDCFLYNHPNLFALRMLLGIAVTLTIFACCASVIWSANLWLFRRWIVRFGQDEFRAYLYHDRLQRMGTTGRKLNALALKRILR